MCHSYIFTTAGYILMTNSGELSNLNWVIFLGLILMAMLETSPIKLFLIYHLFIEISNHLDFILALAILIKTCLNVGDLSS